jgi:hypothetical protein
VSTPPTPRELARARETAEVALADVALAVLDAALHHEHPTIDEPHERDPPTLRAARSLRRRIRALRDQLHHYRRAVLDHDEVIEELPF